MSWSGYEHGAIEESPFPMLCYIQAGHCAQAAQLDGADDHPYHTALCR